MKTKKITTEHYKTRFERRKQIKSFKEPSFAYRNINNRLEKFLREGPNRVFLNKYLSKERKLKIWKRYNYYLSKKGINTNLSYTNLEELDLSGFSFIGANFYRANLRGSNLYNTDFSTADLRETDLRDTELAGASFYRALLQDTDLRGVLDLGKTSRLGDAILRNVKINQKDEETLKSLIYQQYIVRE